MIKLMHVEDDRDIREIAEMSLMMTGEFDLIQCESGEAALEAVGHDAPDVLLLDMMMPGLNGLETLTRMRGMSHLTDVPAIFMSARSQIREMGDLDALGVLDVIPKPFDPLALPGQIKAILAKA